MLASHFCSLIKAGYSATLIDPHGDLAELVLAKLAQDGYFAADDAFDRLLYLDIPEAARRGRFLRFNALRQPFDPYTVSRLTLEAMRRAFPELAVGAPAFEQLVTAGTHVLAENGLSLPYLRPLLLPQMKPWRDRLLARVTDHLITSFFHDEFDRWDTKLRDTLLGSTMRRLFLLLYNPMIRYALSAKDNVWEYTSILKRRKSAIVNLKIHDQDTHSLLGCLLTVWAEQGARAREDVSDDDPTADAFLIIDEAHDFVTKDYKAFTGMLSETRKQRYFLVFSHQTIGQLPERLLSALQNVEVELTFRLGREDAEVRSHAIGTVDPMALKKQEAVYMANNGVPKVIDHHTREKSLPEQWEELTQSIQRQPKRMAFLRDPQGVVTQIKTPDMPDPVVDRDRLAWIKEGYLRRYFGPPVAEAAPNGWQPDQTPHGLPRANSLAVIPRRRGVVG